MKQRCSLTERLSSQRPLVGLLQTHFDSAFAEMAGICGYDFLLLDGEHGVFSEQDYLHTLQVLAANNVLGMVRLATHDPHAVGRYLDMGADAIVAPNVSTAEQARMLARAMEYPPTGTRGFGASLHRCTRYGLDVGTHLQAPRQGVSLLVIIESAVGVANADAILAVEGVDGVIIGPSDLSTDLGFAGNFVRAEYAEAVSRIERAAATQGKVLGTAPHPGNPLEVLVARGHRLLILGADISLIREALTTQMEKARSCLEAS